ncbi:hypothetical protein K227x_01550 [Rubripirellula lacrimiformis]|uniref:Uncharacterized protein n=1 Tax=Rubripirellula lacrimiformis TaxID=1930273 RepID=A0A517N3S2_9BACT|nr:hypothetical protein [Rubripirellula lacrimiformis]QDT01787.1 hypothetical protein K227x_01550 [Rubripirellula lacrimiformis]
MFLFTFLAKIGDATSISGLTTGGILRVASPIAYMAGLRCRFCRVQRAPVAGMGAETETGNGVSAWAPQRFALNRALQAIAMVMIAVVTADAGPSEILDTTEESPTASTVPELERHVWNFGRDDDVNFDNQPDGWKRAVGVGYPKYVRYSIAARDAEFEKRMLQIDTEMVRLWRDLRPLISGIPPLPPSLSDATVNRYLKIELDGGQLQAQSQTIDANRRFQYRFSADIMTQGLRHDTARAELVFLDDQGQELGAYSTEKFGGTTNWTTTRVRLVRPPMGSRKMLVRVLVQRSDDGLEDIRGTVGFDNLMIEQYPQLQVTTDESRGVYSVGQPVLTTAKIMGLPAGASQIQFVLLDHDDHTLAEKVLSVDHLQHKLAPESAMTVPVGPDAGSDSEVTWTLPLLEPGYYRVAASIVGKRSTSLATDVSLVVIGPLVPGPPHGPFGWTLPDGAGPVPPRSLTPWLSNLGVAWVKYPCWIDSADVVRADETASLLSKLQDAGIQTVGMLDIPPDTQLPRFDLRGRRDIVAAQLFRDAEIWQPLLEPIMNRLTLKVRKWQLGSDRDHSFLGRPRLREAISLISTGLQGFGQPIDIAISWPWLEEELDANETSWQAICRSIDPPLATNELDAFLELAEERHRGGGPDTWLLLDPISKRQYDRDTRIRDLVLRMATVRSHRVQACFVSNPHDPDQGLLRPSGRPDEMLLPWRTTSRLIGNLRNAGSLQLRSGANNSVFVGRDRAVLMLWAPKPTEEKIYLGENVQQVDVWGRVTDLPTHPDPVQPSQHVSIGPVPTFIIGADPSLLGFRMSVSLNPEKLDSLLGQIQTLSVQYANPTRDSMLGTMRIRTPDNWTVSSPLRQWEAAAGRSGSESFEIVLGNTAKIGTFQVPVQFELETIPPKLITVHRTMDIGPEGLELKVTTRLLGGNDLRVQIEMTNRSPRVQSYDCLLFPPPGRQYQRQFITIQPGETTQRDVYWRDAKDLLGKQMLLRAIEQDGKRVVNYTVNVKR